MQQDTESKHLDMRPGIRLGLDTISTLLRHLDSPHLKVPIIHIAGTNGKGSVSALLDAMLSAGGIRTGRFNSPHLVTINDSVLLQGKPISDTAYSNIRCAVERIDKDNALRASSFEMLTATAFLAFARAEPLLDVAIVEVGMGGADDATNVVPSPLLSILTNVDLDHQAFLGDTVEEIAKVKCGIFKPQRPCLVGLQTHATVLRAAERQAQDVDAPFFAVPTQLPSDVARIKTATGRTLHVDVGLQGRHQLENTAVAVSAIEILRERYPSIFNGVSDDAIRKGAAHVDWPGRLTSLDINVSSTLQLRVLADGAHNPSSARLLGQHLASLPPADKTVIVMGLSHPRKPSSILEPITESLNPELTEVMATQFTIPVDGMPWVKALDPDDIVHTAKCLGLQSKSTESLKDALLEISRREDAARSRIVIAGSLYLMSDLYRLLRHGFVIK